MSEVLVDVLLVLVGAILGGWSGFFLAKRRESRLLAIESAVSVLNADVSAKRTRFRDFLTGSAGPTIDFDELVEKSEGRFHPIRNDIYDVMNRYDLICLAACSGDLDRKIFDETLRPLIQSDFDLVDPVFDAAERRFISIGEPERRPFFPYIHKLLGGRTE